MVGFLSVIFIIGSIMVTMAVSNAKQGQAAPGHKLQASKEGGFNFDLDAISWSSSLTTIIWGLILAKAKAGHSAASSGKVESIQSTTKTAFILVGLIACASFLKINNDYHIIDSIVPGDE